MRLAPIMATAVSALISSPLCISLLLSPLLVCLASAQCAKVLKVDRGRARVGQIRERQLEHACRGVMS
jgi:hypothetical protein